jgi:hypothetical protein
MPGAVTGEFLGGSKGFGELIRIAASQLNMPCLFSLILYLSLVGLALCALVLWVQRTFVVLAQGPRHHGRRVTAGRQPSRPASSPRNSRVSAKIASGAGAAPCGASGSGHGCPK